MIPAYNEEKRIGKTLEDFEKTLIGKYQKRIKIIVVSDSIDKTNEIVLRHASKYDQIELIGKNIRDGKGAAIIDGLKLACSKLKTDIVGFVDADPSVSGKEIIRMLEKFGDRNVDGVIASRYLRESKIIGKLKPQRFAASRIFNFVVRLLFGFKFTDTQCGAKFFRLKAVCSVLDKIDLVDITFDVNLLYEMKINGFNVIEVPITYVIVNEGSKIDVKKDLPKAIIIAAGYRINRSMFGYFIPKRIKHIIYNNLKNW